jgi:hypothetical protein
MIREFGVDPDSICDFDNFRYVVDSMGIHKGKLISKYPHKWKKLVYNACANWHSKQIGQEIRYNSIVERLRNIDDKLIPSNRAYNSQGKTWLENAIEQHIQIPFGAIIACNKMDGSDYVIDVNELAAGLELWDVPTQCICERKPEKLAECLQMLFRVSKEIIFVDPYFNPTKKRYQETIGRYLEVAGSEMPTISRIEYHRIDEGLTSLEDFEHNCLKFLPMVMPAKIQLKFIIWRRRPYAETLHARYVLTDKGGIGYDFGLDMGDGKHTGETTDVRLLDKTLYEERWKSFQNPSPDFDRIYYFDVTGSAKTIFNNKIN